MRISLQFTAKLFGAIERLEPIKWYIYTISCTSVAVGAGLVFVMSPIPNRSAWYLFFPQLLALVILTLLLLRRRSLRWRAHRLLKSIKEPGVFLLSKWIADFLRFRSLSACLLVWILFALAIFPLYSPRSSSRILNYSKSLLECADPSFFMSLWQVHATVLGVFLVIMTFVFQFVSLRRAYETSLLPYLAKSVHLAPIIIINFIYVVGEMYAAVLNDKGPVSLIAKYGAVLGLIFSVLSAIYLLLRVLDLLRPEAIEMHLNNLVKKNLAGELEKEHFMSLAANILAEECLSCGIEYSEIDISRRLPAIRSEKLGRIADVNLYRLAKFGKHLSTPLSSGAMKSLIVKMLDDELTQYDNVLARVSSADRTQANERLARRAFRVEEYDNR